MKRYSKEVYVLIVVVATACLFLSYVPGLHFLSKWCTPPVIKAKPENMSVALAVVFVLNAIALFVFPTIGHWLGVTQQEFGTWAAIAIHDTSSVVGASLTTDVLRAVGIKPLIQGVLLWIVISIGSLLYIM